MASGHFEVKKFIMSESTWTPPKFGSPVWLGISAKDVARAEAFYTTVFNWTIKASPRKPEQSEIDAATRLVDWNPDVKLSGGIVPRPDGDNPTAQPPPGPGGVVLYWFVEDLTKTAETIERAGGKMIGSKEPIKEGDAGLYRFFEDTEGNVGAVYQLVSNKCG
ncbi:hypothetical protein VTJ49DRAFT_7598 [Mycothermus thermophilus]|uniref:VOC domain-containing protein n=1 Tax=Humicola insolens TaxID=85995 RepID=A0ABR3VGF8_HUMIN